MPAKNALKLYVCDGFYHLYNRGVEKRVIFLDAQDHMVFLHFLKECLSPPPPANPAKVNSFRYKNLYESVELLSFVLMPNHFHLFVYQRMRTGIEILMRSIITRYVFYFNKKYDRQGHLFQGRYKAIQVETEPYFLYLHRYIHRNALSFWTDSLEAYPYSSYPYYLGKRSASWLNTSRILFYFSTVENKAYTNGNSYGSFIENNSDLDKNQYGFEIDE